MGDQITAIKNITNKTKNWKAKVYVLEKWEPRVARKDSLRYQKLVFSDPEGTRVQATLFEGLIEKFEDTLQIFKSYHISNAGVKFLEQGHRIGSHPWQWTIHGSTLIQLVENEDPVRGLGQYNIISFSQFPNHVDTQSEINILAAVVKIKPSKIIQTQIGESTAQEIVVINQESLPTILTLWDQFISNEGAKLVTIGDSFPIIIGIRLKVTSYCGQSLSTRPKSTFILNPDSPDAHTLRSWCIENEDSIRAMSLLRERQSPRNQTPTPKAEQIVQIVAIPSSPDALYERMYWIKATMSIASLNQSFWYMSCSSCFKSIRADYGTIFDCIHCKNKKVVAQPRLKFEIQLKDSSGSMIAIMFHDHAEKFFSLNSVQLMNQTSEDGKISNEAFTKLTIEEDYVIQIKPRQYQFRGTSKLQFVITSVNDADSTTATTTNLQSTTSTLPNVDPKAKKQLFQEDTPTNSATTAGTSSETTFR